MALKLLVQILFELTIIYYKQRFVGISFEKCFRQISPGLIRVKLIISELWTKISGEFQEFGLLEKLHPKTIYLSCLMTTYPSRPVDLENLLSLELVQANLGLDHAWH